MSERELRRLAELCEQTLAYEEVGLRKKIHQALADKPDVVKVDRVLRRHKLEPPKTKVEKVYLAGWADAITVVADNLERKFGFHLTDDGGWEWTDDTS